MKLRPIIVALLLSLALTGACRRAEPAPAPDRPSPEAVPPPLFRSWGTMREALREGRSEGRVDLQELGGEGVVAVGALAGLEGEVTIIDDRVLVARVRDGALQIEEGRAEDRATLLVHAAVARWTDYSLPDCDSYEELEAAIRKVLSARGSTLKEATPLRVRGRAKHLAYHVIRGSCPIADPDGTPPWRFSGPLSAVEIVGIYAEGAAGRWTHHDHASHLHVTAPGHMGHLDEISLAGVTLSLPAGL
jgi:hypothetical protein